MQKPDFLKLIREIERKWGVEIDRARWWEGLKITPGPIALWKLKRIRKQDKPPGLAQIATTSFYRDELPEYLHSWWKEKHWNTWPLIGNRFVCPEDMSRFDRYHLDKDGPRNKWISI